MTYQVRNIIIGAAAIYLSAKDSTQAGWVAATGTAATASKEEILAGQNGPSLPKVASGSLVTGLDADADFKHVGFTSEGLEISYEPDYGDVEVDQLLDSAKLFKQSMRVTVNTTFTEASLENLLVVWGQGATTLTSSGTDTTLGFAAGALGDEPTERALVAVGPGPRTAAGAKRERVYHARRVLSVESSSQALRRNEATVFPVSFRLLPDPLFVAAEYGIIRDRTVA
jgi:hypothetical protein